MFDELSLISFSRELFWHIRNEHDSNICVSPLSVYAALALLLPGCAGKTRNDLLKAFHLPTECDFEALNKELGKTMQGLLCADRESEAVRANGIFLQKGLDILESYLSSITENHGATAAELDFATDSSGARNTINQWIAGHTNNMIQELLSPSVISKDTRLVLANALYFKGTWRERFAPEATRSQDFTLLDGTRIETKFMFGKKKCLYADIVDMKTKVIQLAFKDHKLLVALPDFTKDLPGLLHQLFSPESGDGHFVELLSARNYNLCDVIVSLPKFKIDGGNIKLEEILTNLGLASLFSEYEADLSGINGRRDLSVSAVVHQAKIDVNEEGAEASAATAIAVNRRCAVLKPQEPIEFKVDHPFLFMIMTNSGYPLFIGTFARPPTP